MNQHTTKTRVTVTGLGKRGLLHASFINALPDTQLVALYESKGIVRSFARKMFGNANFPGNTGEPVNDTPDAVYVTTPPSSHFPIIRQIFSGKVARNIFLEKPLAGNQQQAEEICKLIPDNSGVNMAGYQKRFAVTYRKDKELLDNGEIGELVCFELRAYTCDFIDIKKESKQPGTCGQLYKI